MTTKKLSFAILIVLFFNILSACGPSEPPVEVQASELCNEKWEDKTIITYGRLYLPEEMMFINSYPLILDAPGDNQIPYVSIYIGNGKNEMKELPENYTDEDVAILADDGTTVITVGDSVRITGEMMSTAATNCQLYVNKIEKL